MNIPFSKYNKQLDYVTFRFNDKNMELSEKISDNISVDYDIEGDIIGGIIKDVYSSLFKKVPGLRIDSNKRSIEVEHLVRACMYLETEESLFSNSHTYLSLLRMLRNCKLKVVTNELDLDRSKASLSCLDVGRYILNITGPISRTKLSILLYYCQAWSVVWDEKPLFFEGIYCSVGGPYCTKLYENVTIDKMIVSASDLKENIKEISEEQKETIDSVIDYYKRFFDYKYNCDNDDYCYMSLSDISTSEDPFRLVYEDCSPKTNYTDYIKYLRTKEITLSSMLEYYENL